MIGKDKIQHFFASFVITLILNLFMPLVHSVIIAVSFRVGKELHDLNYDSQDADLWDLLADFLGIITALIIIVFVFV